MKPRIRPRGTVVYTSWSKTYNQLDRVMYDLGLDEWGVTSYQDAKRMGGAVTLHYQDEGRRVEMRVSAGENAEANLRAIYFAMESRRMNIVRGVDDAVAATYLALPAPPSVRDPYEVLGVRPDAPLEVVEASFRALARQAHPDRGGSDAAMRELNSALERVRSDRGVAA